MDAQMSSYPPPPQPDQQHYNPIYTNDPEAQQPLDQVQQDQYNFASLTQSSPYPKADNDLLDPHTSSQLEQRIEQLRHQEPLPPHSPQHVDLQPQQQSPQQPQQQNGHHHKQNRLRKACDSCSIRKVKCDESGPPCKACAALDIPCTFQRPSRRRGPPNRHAEAIKRRRIESPQNSGQSAPSSPTHAAQALAALSSHTAVQPSSLSLALSLSAESICPPDVLELLINDYFTYIHPLCPFPHEPSFREAWKRREDYNNRPFLALLASMIAALVASFPRKPRLHLKQHRKEIMFPNHLALVEKCQKVCAAARGSGYLESDTLSVHDAATSYLLGMAGCYTFRWRQCRLYFGECLTILRALGLHKAKEQNFINLGRLPAVVGSDGPGWEGNKDDMLDYITLEMGRRIFWTMFVTFESLAQLGARFSEIFVAPETPNDPYPPLPAEVDDFCIFPTHIEQQPPGLLPMMSGFNANVRVYLSCKPISIVELTWGFDQVVDWEQQKRVLQDALQNCKSAMDSMPPDLTVWTSGGDQSNGNDPFSHFQPILGQRDPAMISMHDMEPTLEERRRMQYEIQKANIYANGLAIRSYIVEKYLNISESYDVKKEQQGNSLGASAEVTAAGLDGLLSQALAGNSDTTEREMINERERIIKDLLIILSRIDKVNVEPNADSFTHKIRSIASTLLYVPEPRKGPIAQNADQYLRAFLDTLVKLERVNPANGDPERPEDGQTELALWADLGEYQSRFAEQGGVLSFI